MSLSASLSARGLLSLLLCLSALACASGRTVKTQAYARLSATRTYETDFATVWKGIGTVLREFKVVEKDPEEASPTELRKMTAGKVETDWVYSQSRDKYVEYKVNSSPRKQYLQMRYRYRIALKTRIGGTDVTVLMDEEIEKLKEDGTPAGYSGVDRPDSSRANELLEKIQQSILAAAP